LHKKPKLEQKLPTIHLQCIFLFSSKPLTSERHFLILCSTISFLPSSVQHCSASVTPFSLQSQSLNSQYSNVIIVPQKAKRRGKKSRPGRLAAPEPATWEFPIADCFSATAEKKVARH
jgi:hypothetical protein